MRCWYVVHSRANAERRALQNLEKQGYVSWLPLCRKTRRHARRIETVLRPLFPRYLFVQLDLDVEPWRAVLSTYGVQSLVGDGETPLPVDQAVVDGLLASAGGDGVFELRSGDLAVGQRVRATVGPLTELEGIFEAQTDAERVRVLFKLMGRDVRVTMHSRDLERA